MIPSPSPGTNADTSSKSATPPQSPSNASKNTNYEPSVTKGINTTLTKTAESGTNISLESKQNEASKKFDPYIDALLSGTLERIHVDDHILSLAANCDSHYGAQPDESLIDHNYFNSRNATKIYSYPSTTQQNNDPDEHPEPRSNQGSKGITLDNDKYGVQSDDIETEIVCMELTELDITNIQDSIIPTHYVPGSIPGTNTLTPTVHTTNTAIEDTLTAFKDINITGDSVTVTGTNDKDPYKNMLGTNIGTVKGMNNMELAVSENLTIGNMRTNIIQGINSHDNSCSESSEFESFTSGDLKCANMSDVDFTDDASTILTSDNYVYDDAVEDSSDTIPAIDPIGRTEDKSQELQDLLSV